MESIPEDKILQYNTDTLEVVRKAFDLNKPGAMSDAVDILEKWVQVQSHFTKTKFDRRYLETTIIISKGSLEKAKSRLDRACTLRTLMPHLFEIYNIRQFFKTDLIDIKHAVLPKMTKNHERVYIFKNVGQSFEPTAFPSFLRAASSMCEYLRRADYTLNNIAVIDYFDVNYTALIKILSITYLQELVALTMDCCGFRVKAICIISSSKIIETVVAIFKQVLSPKLGKRIHIVKDRASLKNVIDDDILPKEYGGSEKSLDELHEQWLDVLTSEDHIEYLKDINMARTNESYRQKDNFNDQYLGMPGTFRTISLD